MNLFPIDTNTEHVAMWLNDQRVGKIAQEGAQVLSDACWAVGIEGPLGRYNIHNPWVKWALESYDNCVWIADLVHSCLAQHWSRKGPGYLAASGAMEYAMDRLCDHPGVPHWLYTRFPLTVQQTSGRNLDLVKRYENGDDATDIYRAYYTRRIREGMSAGGRKQPTWTTPGEMPDWMEVNR